MNLMNKLFPARGLWLGRPAVRLVRSALLLLTLFAVLRPQARAQVSEYQLKAAFLANFPEFVTWPATAFSGSGAPIVIGILGDDPFGGALDRAAQTKNVGGRKVTIRRSQRAEDLKGCHIVFIAKSERARLAAILASLGTGNVLTVADTEQFTGQGGAIGLIMAGDTVRLEINNGAAQRAGLAISSRLLRLSR